MPSLPGRQCRVNGCSGIATSANNGYCDKHKNHGWAMYQRDNPNRFYQSTRWKKIRIVVIRRAFGLCQDCEKRGILVSGNNVDHILPVSQGGAIWDLDNLQLLCETCHNAKTAKE